MEKQQESKGEDRSSRLTRDKIERELARVTAQLRPTEPPRTEEERPKSETPATVGKEQEKQTVEPEVTRFEPAPQAEREHEETMPSALADATVPDIAEPSEEEAPKTPAEPEEPRISHDLDEVEEEEALVPTVEDEPEPDAEPEPESEPMDESKPEPEPETEPESDEEEPEEEEPEEVTYGRTKTRHRLDRSTIEAEAESADESKAEPEAEDSFSNEGISFGRGKRKKTR